MPCCTVNHAAAPALGPIASYSGISSACSGARPPHLHIGAGLALDGGHSGTAAAQHRAHHAGGHQELELHARVVDGAGVALRVAAADCEEKRVSTRSGAARHGASGSGGRAPRPLRHHRVPHIEGGAATGTGRGRSTAAAWVWKERAVWDRLLPCPVFWAGRAAKAAVLAARVAAAPEAAALAEACAAARVSRPCILPSSLVSFVGAGKGGRPPGAAVECLGGVETQGESSLLCYVHGPGLPCGGLGGLLATKTYPIQGPEAPGSPGEIREVMDQTARYSLAVPALEISSSEEMGDTTAVLIVHSPRAGRRKRGEAPPPQRWAACCCRTWVIVGQPQMLHPPFSVPTRQARRAPARRAAP